MTKTQKITTATAFMEYMFPDGDWTITVIRENAGPRTHVFSRDAQPGSGKHISDLQGLIDAQRPDENIYYQPNRLTRRMGPGDKAGEADVASLDHLQVDIDPLVGEDIKKEQDRILARLLQDRPKVVPHPSVIVFSGGGYQAFWKLKEPIKVDGDIGLITDLKRYSMWLADRLDGDSCFNPAHLMRLPFTMNNPTKRKLEKNPGREAVTSSVVNADGAGQTYALSDFKKSQTKDKVKLGVERLDIGSPETPKIEDLMMIEGPSDLLPAIVCRNNGFPPGREDGDPAFDPERWPSRSEQVFYVCCVLVRAGVTDETLLGILLNPDWGVSESILEKKHHAHRYAIKQIESAHASVQQSDKATDETNSKVMGELKFICNEDGLPYKSLSHNHRVAVQELGYALRKDEFARMYMVEGLGDMDGPLSNEAVNRVRYRVESRFGFKVAKDPMRDLLGDIAEDNRFHPVVEYLDGLIWDGQNRLDDWLTRYMGAPLNDYTKAIGKIVLIAAVRRVRRPGCKYDEMLILEGPQGAGKSTALRMLAIKDEWFADELPLGGSGKEVMEAIGGKWIVEAAELAGITKKDAKDLKSMLSRTFDKGRKAYGHFSEQVERQCVFIATHNPDAGANQYLNDPTGARRFWPVICGKVDLGALEKDRDQLWAEACDREARNESIRLDPSLYHLAAGEQKKRQQENPMETRLEGLVGQKSGRIAVSDVYEVLGVSMQNHQMTQMLGRAAKSLGFDKKRLNCSGRQQNCYVRGGPEDHFIELIPVKGRDGRWDIVEKHPNQKDILPENWRE